MEKNFRKKLKNSQGITLIALVVTLIVLLILAGVLLSAVLSQDGIFSRAENAKVKTDIAHYKEMLEIAKNPVLIDGIGTFNPDKYWEEIENQNIINDKTKDVVDNGDGTYDVTTKPGYVFLVELIPTKEKPRDAKIDYIGEAGKILPIIRKIETSATNNSIISKAVVSRLKNGSVEYWCKISTEDDSKYKKMTNLDNNEGAELQLIPVEGTTYKIKVTAKNEAGEHTEYDEITIGLKVTGITLDKETIIAKPNDKLQLNPIIIPEEAENKEVTWSTNKPEIATVDENGVVTAVAIGNAVITATTKDGSNLSATCNIEVKIPVESIALDKTSASVYTEETITLVATITPTNATNKNVKWSSSDDSIATVDQTGKVTGKANGNAVITVTSSDDTSKTASCTVKVTEEDDWEEISKWAGQIAKDTSINSSSESATVNLTEGGTRKITVGDTFKVKYNGTALPVRLLGFKHDILSVDVEYGEKGTFAGMSFEFVNVIEQCALHSSTKDRYGYSAYLTGWGNADLRAYLNGNSSSIGGVALQLSNHDFIKKVAKPYIKDRKTKEVADSNDWLWILSISEASYDKSYAVGEEGNMYLYYSSFCKDASKRNLSGSVTDWWTRSMSVDLKNCAGYHYGGGMGQADSASPNVGVSPGFCI